MDSGFCFTSFDWIGFDLDHTLVRYKLRALHQLIYDGLVKHLVENLHHEASLKQVPLRFEFAKKGVVVDKRGGNLLKLDSRRRIVRAYHGTTLLQPAEVECIYGAEPVIELPSTRYWALPTYFEAACADIFAALVVRADLDADKRGEPQRERDYSYLATDIISGLDFNFGDFNRGWYFPAIRAHPEKYLQKQPRVRTWLQRLRQHGVRLLLLTNSMADYTSLLMNYSYGSDWRTLFDLIIFEARKPHFFIARCDFHTVDLETWRLSSPHATITLGSGEHYARGNAAALLDAITQPTNDGDQGAPSRVPKVCYIGDHIISDVEAPSKNMQWQTVAIMEELEDLESEAQWSPPAAHALLDEVQHFEESFESGTGTNADHPSHNEHWGSFFVAGAGTDDTLSFWAHTSLSHAALLTPSLDRIARFSVEHVFDRAHASVDVAGHFRWCASDACVDPNASDPAYLASLVSE